MTSKRRLRRQRGKLRAAYLVGIRSGDAGCIDFADLRAEARRRLALERELQREIDCAEATDFERQMQLADDIMLQDHEILRELSK